MDLFGTDDSGIEFGLGPTATYSRRTGVWTPATDTAPGFEGRIGDLTLVLTKPSGKVERDTYAVELSRELPGLMGKVFRLTSLTDPDQEKPYEVVLGGIVRCDCPAGEFRAKHGVRACKHLEAIAAVLDSGLICGLVTDDAHALATH